MEETANNLDIGNNNALTMNQKIKKIKSKQTNKMCIFLQSYSVQMTTCKQEAKYSIKIPSFDICNSDAKAQEFCPCRKWMPYLSLIVPSLFKFLTAGCLLTSSTDFILYYNINFDLHLLSSFAILFAFLLQHTQVIISMKVKNDTHQGWQ